MGNYEHELRKTPDRGTLRRLANGIEITRAVKHEPIDFDRLSGDQLRRATNPNRGAKFLGTWPLVRLVDWTEQQVMRQQWQFPPGASDRIRVRVAEPVGYVDGRLVHTIRVVIDGRYVHAYPDQDQP